MTPRESLVALRDTIRDGRLRSRARQTLRYELEGAAKDGSTVPNYGDPGHEDWTEVCHARDVLALLREVETLRRESAVHE